MYTKTIELCDLDGHAYELDLSDLDPEIPIVFYDEEEDKEEDPEILQLFTLYFKSGSTEDFRVDWQTPDNMAVLHYIDETW